MFCHIQFVTLLVTGQMCCFVTCSKVKMITSHVLTADSSQLLLGTDGGSIHMFDVENFTLTDNVILQDLVLQK